MAAQISYAADEPGGLASLLDFGSHNVQPEPEPARTSPGHVESLLHERQSNATNLALSSVTSLEGQLNIIVAGLTREVDDVNLRDMFAPFGRIVSATVMRHVGTGVSRGFGFVLFANEEQGESAIKAMHGRKCGPNTLNVHRSLHDGTIVETNSVFVRNLPLDVTTERVVAFFTTVGHVASAEITDDMARDAGSAPNGKRFRVATVSFTNVEDARNAVRMLHNTPFPVRPSEESPLVIVKFAESAEYRRKRRGQKPKRGNSNSSKSSPNASAHASTSSAPPTILAMTPPSYHPGMLPMQHLSFQPLQGPQMMYVNMPVMYAGPNGQFIAMDGSGLGQQLASPNPVQVVMHASNSDQSSSYVSLGQQQQGGNASGSSHPIFFMPQYMPQQLNEQPAVPGPQSRATPPAPMWQQFVPSNDATQCSPRDPWSHGSQT